MSKFAETLSQLIESKNLTLRKLSELTGISSSQLSKYASGNYEPTLKNALILSDFFDCSLDYLFGRDVVTKCFSILSPIDVNKFCERFNKLIELRNTNINRISKNSYLNRNSIYNWLNSKIFPKVGIIAKLADELDTTIEYLIGRTDCME